MASIDEIANDLEWQPNLDKEVVSGILGDFISEGEPTELRAVIRELNNGLLIASIEDKDGKNVFIPGKKYNVDSIPELPNQYNLVRLTSEQNPLKGFYATFEHKDGGKSDTNPIAHIRYTTLHTPFYGQGKSGLNLLMSLYAMQSVGNQKLTLSLTHPKEFVGQRYHNTLLGYTGEPGGGFFYDNNGELLPDSPGFKNLPKNMKGPLAELFYNTLKRSAKMDTQSTAKRLVKEFPSLGYKLPTQLPFILK